MRARMNHGGHLPPGRANALVRPDPRSNSIEARTQASVGFLPQACRTGGPWVRIAGGFHDPLPRSSLEEEPSHGILPPASSIGFNQRCTEAVARRSVVAARALTHA